jgi:hypothetical protein
VCAIGRINLDSTRGLIRFADPRDTLDHVNNPVASIAVGILVLSYVMFRQLQKRSVRADAKPTLLLILALVGVIDLVQFLHGHPVHATGIAMLVASLVLAAGFGVARAYTIRLWRENGLLYRQGNVVTLLLWLVGIAVHFGADTLIDGDGASKGLASAALVLYIAISFGVQRLVVNSRARSLVGAY